ncbi:ribosomal L28 family [Wolffia australiana]
MLRPVTAQNWENKTLVLFLCISCFCFWLIVVGCSARKGMAFRSQQLYKKLGKKLGEEIGEEMKKCLPDGKIVMGRANRGIFAGRHIQFGNRVSEDGGNKTRRTWKPNVQEKRLFSYALDRHIRVKVTTHALRCIDKAGGIDEYLLNTPYHKMDTELGLLWKAKMEKLYQELGQAEAFFFSPEEEAKIKAGFDQYRVAKRTSRSSSQAAAAAEVAEAEASGAGRATS